MKKQMKMWIALALSFMFCFTCVGYAQVTTNLSLVGSATVEPPKDLFIFSVSAPSGVTETHAQLTMNSTVTLGTEGNSTQSVEITLFNNNDIDYYFSETVYTVGPGTYDNESIVFALNGLVKNQKIAPAEYLTFTVTFSYRDGTAVSNSVLNSALTFQFGLSAEDATEVVSEGALGRVEYGC